MRELNELALHELDEHDARLFQESNLQEFYPGNHRATSRGRKARFSFSKLSSCSESCSAFALRTLAAKSKDLYSLNSRYRLEVRSRLLR